MGSLGLGTGWGPPPFLALLALLRVFGQVAQGSQWLLLESVTNLHWPVQSSGPSPVWQFADRWIVGGSLGSGKLACGYFGALWWVKNERVETLQAAAVWITYFCTIYLETQQAWQVIFVFYPGSLISWGCWELSYRAAFPCSLLLSCWIQSLQPPTPLSAVYGHIWSVSLHTCWYGPPPCWHTRHGFGGLWSCSHPSQHLFFHEREGEKGYGKGSGREDLWHEIPRNGICTFYDRSDGNAMELNYSSLILLSHFPPSSLFPCSLGNTEAYKQIPLREKNSKGGTKKGPGLGLWWIDRWKAGTRREDEW